MWKRGGRQLQKVAMVGETWGRWQAWHGWGGQNGHMSCGVYGHGHGMHFVWRVGTGVGAYVCMRYRLRLTPFNTS